MKKGKSRDYRPYLFMIVLVTAWVLALSLSLSTVCYESEQYQGGKISWAYFLAYALTYHGAWILLAPLLLVVFDRFPFKQGAFLFTGALHLVSGVAFCSLKWCLEYSLLRTLSFWIRPFGTASILMELINYFTLLIAYSCIRYYRGYREREARAVQLEAELAKARLQVLKMQLNPHFLFNTLHAVSSLVYDEPAVADRMISRLSDLLRVSLEKSNTQMVPLKEELVFLEHYLDIERIRFKDRLSVVMEIEPEALTASTPSLILQPLVENAVKHGFERSADQGRIIVRGRRDRGKLVLEVCDNGKGLKEGEGKAFTGVGLENTRARLLHLYGGEADLSFESPNEAGGFTVTLTMPFDRDERDEIEKDREP
ncbi:MAG: histidine kinase [Planctomycetes bacterium]|nr:histidine kinase [Planctomycetota bacterium]